MLKPENIRLNKMGRRVVSVVLLLGLGVVACTDPEKKSGEFLKQGQTYYEQGEYAKARLQIKNALQRDPRLVAGYYTLALLDEKDKNWPGVYRNLAKAVELDPQHNEARIKLGQLYLLNRELEKALAEAEAVLAAVPDDPKARTLKAATLFHQGDITAAQEEISQVLSGHPDHIDAKALMTTIYLAEKNYQPALKLLAAAIQQHPKERNFRLLQIKAHVETQQLDAVEQDFRNLIELFPEEKRYRYSLAEFLNKLDRGEEAEAVLREAVSSDAADADAKLALFEFLSLKDPAAAENELKNYVEQDPANPSLVLKLANLYREQGRFDEAKTMLRRLLDNATGDGAQKSRLMLATIALQTGDSAEATVLIKALLEKNQSDPEALLLRAMLHLDNKKPEDAIADLRLVLRDKPDSDRALVLLAQAYLLNGMPELASENFRKALTVNPANFLAALPVAQAFLRKDQINKAEDVLKDLLELRPEYEPALQLLSKIRMLKKDWQGAGEVVEQLRQKPEARALADALSGMISSRQGNYEAALEKFKTVLKDHPDLPEALEGIVQTYETMGRRAVLIDYLIGLTQRSQDNARIHALLGTAYARDKSWDKAIGSLNRALELQPKSVYLYGLLVDVYELKGDSEAVAETFERGLKILPGNAPLMLGAASNLEKTGQIDAAIAAYERILELHANSELAINNLASLLSDYRQDSDSLDRSRQLVERLKNSENPYFLDTYAWALLRKGEFPEEAQKILKQVVNEAGTVAIFRYHLAVAYQQMQQPQKAVRELETAIELAQDETLKFAGFDDAKKRLAVLNSAEDDLN